MASDDRSVIFERLVRLEGVVKQQGDEQDDHGGVLDHLVNTLDTIVLPTQAAHTTQIAAQAILIEKHDKVTSEAHDYIMSQRGAWSFIQKAGIVVAALASVATVVMKLMGK